MVSWKSITYQHRERITTNGIAKSWILSALHPFFVKISSPHSSFARQTIIVTGSNLGLGLETANHLVRLSVDKLILAVRNTLKGEKAKTYIENKTGKKGVVEVCSLDLSSYPSFDSFVERAAIFLRINVFLENAGISTNKFPFSQDNGSVLHSFLQMMLATMITIDPGLLLQLMSSQNSYYPCWYLQRYERWPRVLEWHYASRSWPPLFITLLHFPQKPTPKFLAQWIIKPLPRCYTVFWLQALKNSVWPNACTYNDLKRETSRDSELCESRLLRLRPGSRSSSGVQNSKLNLSPLDQGRLKNIGCRGYHGKWRHTWTVFDWYKDCKGHCCCGRERMISVSWANLFSRVSRFVESSEKIETASRVWEDLHTKLDEIQPNILGYI